MDWELDTGEELITANDLTTLDPGEEVLVYVDYNYESTGTKTINATGFNGSLTDDTRNLVTSVSE